MRIDNVSLELGIQRPGPIAGPRPSAVSSVGASSFGAELMSAMTKVDET